MTQLSQFGQKFAQHSGIARLMQDLNEGIRTPGAVMLGGGNPAHIPEMDNYFRQLLKEMTENGTLSDAVCNYDGPQGKDATLQALAACLKEKLGWNISAKNIALTNGSQSAFFYLFNLLGGTTKEGKNVKFFFQLPLNILVTQIQD